MYTRSYGNKRINRTTEVSPPPDYGGTAITIKQNEYSENQNSNSSVIVADRIPRRRDFSKNSDEKNNTLARKNLDTEDVNKRNQISSKFEAPFGENGQPDAAPSSLRKLDKVISNFVDPQNLKSDDLLLLGLIFLLFKEGADNDCTKEAIMLLSILYLTGL